ncbi:hypothetical protein MARA_01400 (plasmid) [Mycolicibacterium arabiense]|uniref:Uncharacterized protein n=1 Tax=Mycolicibacterium arabiense TaxID=1286181 RepID=A0A7I7RR60_9MYCO|nr:hypothetical protein MARA_01400 [Mycolicibacterium arabiense]
MVVMETPVEVPVLGVDGHTEHEHLPAVELVVPRPEGGDLRAAERIGVSGPEEDDTPSSLMIAASRSGEVAVRILHIGIA